METPLSTDLSASLVSFYTTGLKPPDPGRRLWREHQIIVASRQRGDQWLRVSAACFTLEEELRRLVDVLSQWPPQG